MTVEELEILVDASIEPAINKLKKLMPQIKQTVMQAVETTNKSMQNINTKSIQNKVSQAVQGIKKRFDNLKKSTENNNIKIKVNNQEASKQISQLEKEIDSLEKKISARQMKLDIINPQIDSMVNKTKQEVTPAGVPRNSPVMDGVTNSALNQNKEFVSLNIQAQKLYTEMEMYNQQLNEARYKMSQLGQETEKTATTQNKLSSFFGDFKGKIDQTKGSIGNFKGQFNQLPKVTQKITNNIKNMGSKLKSGIGHVLKYAGALLGIRAVYNLLRQSASAWLSSQNQGAQQLSANIEYMKYAMGSALAPVIQFVTNLVYSLLKAIQQVAYALTGVNIFAKATASSMKNTAGSAKKAKKEVQGLADIDEIHNIQKDNGSNSGSGSGTPNPTFDLSKMDKSTNSLIDAIKNGNWYDVGSELGKKLNEAMINIPWNKIHNGARKIAKGLADLLNGFIETTDWTLVGNTIAQGLNTAIYFAQMFLRTFNFDNFGSAISKTINGFLEKVDWKVAGDTVSAGIKGVFDTITGFIRDLNVGDILKAISDFVTGIKWEDVMSSISEAFGTAWGKYMKLHIIIGQGIAQGIVDSINYWKSKVNECGGDIVGGILKGIIDGFVDVGKWIYDNIFKPFIDGFKSAFGIHSPSTVMQKQGKYIIEGFKNGLQGMWAAVKGIFTNVLTGIQGIFSNIGKWFSDKFTSAVTGIKKAFSGIGNFFKNIWKNITNTFSKIPNWFKDKFSKAWTNVKNVFSSGGKVFDGIKNGILKGLKTVINAIIKGINKVIKVPFDGINTALEKIKNINIMGATPFINTIKTISVPQIPTLAKGNVAYGETLAIFGEYSGARNNPEITAPQNIMAETFEKVLNKHSNNGETINFTNELKLNSKILAREIIQDLNNEAKRLGYRPILQRG